MNLNTCSGAGAGAIDLKIASSEARGGAWSILGQLPSPDFLFRRDVLSPSLNKSSE